MTTTIKKIEGEILIDTMETVIKTLPDLQSIYSADHSILIYGMGGQPKSFYRDLQNNADIELLWTGWSSKVWWTYLLSFIPGQSGLVKVLNRQRLGKLFLDIGEQSMCALYFIPNNLVTPILQEIKLNREKADIESLLKGQDNYFLLTVYFDTAEEINSHKYYRKCILADNLPKEIKQTLSTADS